MRIPLHNSLGFVAIVAFWFLAISQVSHGQQSAAPNKVFNFNNTDVFGGIEEVVVIEADGTREIIELPVPHGAPDALDIAASKVGADLRAESVVLCFEVLRQENDIQTATSVTQEPGTLIIGDPDGDPCGVIVVSGQVDITTTITDTTTFFYRMQVHLGVRGSCALRLTAFAYDSENGETTLTWETIPQSQYGIEVSTDMEQWEERKRDVPSQGSSTTETLSNGKPGARELYFRVRLQVDSMPAPL